MSENKVCAVVLAAGQGTRMKSSLPKVLHKIAGRPMVSHLLSTVDSLNAEKAVVVIGPGMERVAEVVAPHSVAVQHKQQGTGDAVKAAREELKGFKGSVLVLYGDSPLIRKETLEEMIRLREAGAAVVVLGFEPTDPGRYGRLIVKDGILEKIVEFKDASEQEKAVRLCNSGVMCLDGEKLFDWLDRLNNHNAAGEYYLTDVVALARADGCSAVVVTGTEEEMAAFKAKCAEYGVEGYILGPIYMKSKAEVDRAFAYAGRYGAEVFIGVPNYELLDYTIQKVKETGIKMAIHTHGPDGAPFPNIQTVVDKVKDPTLGVGCCMDLGHSVRMGEDIVKDIKRYKEWIYDIHIKDETEASKNGNTCEMGRGVMDFKPIIKVLRKIDYQGVISLEFEGTIKYFV